MKRAGAILLMAAAACGGETRPAQVRLALDGASCESDSPGEVALPCGGAVGVWLSNAATGEVLEQRCVSFSSVRQTLDDIPAILSAGGVSFRVAAEQRVVVELAVYGPGQSGCPRRAAGGDPLQFARSEPVLLTGERPVVPLSLECLERAAPCDGGGDSLQVEAELIDLDLLEPLEEGDALGVDMVSAAPSPAGEAELGLLGELSGGGASWSGTVSAPPAEAACLGTLVEGAGGYEFLTCREPVSGDGIETVGYWLEANAVQDLADQVLREGALVIGRTSAAGEPFPADLVVADDPAYTVLSDQEWFVAFREDGAADCCVTFSMSDESQVSSDPVAVMPGVVSLVHLELF